MAREMRADAPAIMMRAFIGSMALSAATIFGGSTLATTVVRSIVRRRKVCTLATQPRTAGAAADALHGGDTQRASAVACTECAGKRHVPCTTCNGARMQRVRRSRCCCCCLGTG
jgi:hypothetical protein